MVSVIEVAGKQFIVEPGKKVVVPRLDQKAGESITFQDMVGSGSLTAKVSEHILGEKVVSRKFRNKTRYQRTKGHRQPLTVIVFESADGEKKPAPKKTTAKAKSE